MALKTKEEFKEFSERFQATHKMPFAFALGIPFYEDKELIAVKWISMNVEKNMGFMSAFLSVSNIEIGEKIEYFALNSHNCDLMLKEILCPFLDEIDQHKNISIIKEICITEYEELLLLVYPSKESLFDKGPVNNADALCRLTMISDLLFKPNEISLDGIFGVLPILVFTPTGVMSKGAYNRSSRFGKFIPILCEDKFPPLHWGTSIQSGVRIADPIRVRLGAYLSPGTTIMHEGFVNFNAGTLGPCMVEGRIASGVVVGDDSDIGGGASIMGMLSGGGKEKITIGKNCLLGANSGTGISLGDRCTIEAGLYVTAGKKVYIVDESVFPEKNNSWVKAKELSGKNDMLFIQNSKTGGLEVLFNKKPNRLNKVLHS